MNDDDLMKALVSTVAFADGLLDQCSALTKALEWETPPSPQQIEEARQNLARWRADLDKLKRLVAGLMIEPPTRPQ